MTKVFEDLSRGGGATRTLSDGTKVSRLFLVSEITGNRPDIIPNALTAGNIPRVGDRHPSIPSIICDTVTANPTDADKAEVTANYSTLKHGNTPVNEEAEVSITLSGSVQSVTTNEFFLSNNKKELMKLEYRYPQDKNPEGVNKPVEIVPTANREQAIITAVMSRLEDEHPLQKAVGFVEHTNKRTFLGTGPRTWLCTSIGGVSNDSGETYQVTYTFEYRSETWDVVLAFADKETGAIPVDVDGQPSAKKPFKLQPTADFGRLRLEGFQS